MRLGAKAGKRHAKGGGSSSEARLTFREHLGPISEDRLSTGVELREGFAQSCRSRRSRLGNADVDAGEECRTMKLRGAVWW